MRSDCSAETARAGKHTKMSSLSSTAWRKQARATDLEVLTRGGHNARSDLKQLISAGKCLGLEVGGRRCDGCAERAGDAMSKTARGAVSMKGRATRVRRRVVREMGESAVEVRGSEGEGEGGAASSTTSFNFLPRSGLEPADCGQNCTTQRNAAECGQWLGGGS